MSRTAIAQEEPTEFPEYEHCRLSDGSDGFCFNLEGMKTLTIAWLERSEFHNKITLLDTKLSLQSDQIDLLKNVITIKDGEITKLTNENTRLFDMWSDENKKRHEAEANQGSSWFPWSLATGLAISTLVLGFTN